MIGNYRGTQVAFNRTTRDKVLAMFDVDPNKPLPKRGTINQININGVDVWIAPVGPRFPKGSHRLVCQCPECKKIVSFGCFDQHYIWMHGTKPKRRPVHKNFRRNRIRSQAEYDEANGTDNGGNPSIQAWQDMHNHEMNS